MMPSMSRSNLPSKDIWSPQANVVLGTMSKQPFSGPVESYMATRAKLLDLAREIDAANGVSNTPLEIYGLVASGRASECLVEAWRLHVLANDGNRAGLRPTPTALPMKFPEALPPFLEDLFERHKIELLPSLGEGVAAVLFTGPRYTRMLLARDRIKDGREATFLILHMQAHLALGQLRVSSLDCRLEFARGETPQELLGQRKYLEAECQADAAATGLWDDAYAGPESMCASGWDVVRRLRGSHLQPLSALRQLLRNRTGAVALLARAVTAAAFAPVFLLHQLVPPGSTFERPRLLSGRDRQAYLVYRLTDGVTGEGVIVKRWIASTKVLYRLGYDWQHIRKVSDERLKAYRYDGLLIDPSEVDHARELIEASKTHRLSWPMLVA